MNAVAPLVVVMGVSGSGKTTLGTALAAALGVPFEEGDTLHPVANIAKMHAGVPLDDADRAPWLDAVAAWLAGHAGTGGIVSCSALKRAYRDRLRCADPNLRFVLLDVDRATLADRVSHRPGHFMPASLLGSQLDTLEPPDGEADALTVDGTAGVERNVARVRAWLAAG